jgi:hypothetical protein
MSALLFPTKEEKLSGPGKQSFDKSIESSHTQKYLFLKSKATANGSN